MKENMEDFKTRIKQVIILLLESMDKNDEELKRLVEVSITYLDLALENQKEDK